MTRNIDLLLIFLMLLLCWTVNARESEYGNTETNYMDGSVKRGGIDTVAGFHLGGTFSNTLTSLAGMGVEYTADRSGSEVTARNFDHCGIVWDFLTLKFRDDGLYYISFAKTADKDRCFTGEYGGLCSYFDDSYFKAKNHSGEFVYKTAVRRAPEAYTAMISWENELMLYIYETDGYNMAGELRHYLILSYEYIKGYDRK